MASFRWILQLHRDLIFTRKDCISSINGVNKYYGTPTNPAAPAHIPGGSSCGSAVAVAANLVDFSIGIDTTGGVRVPAAFCGILGFRTSHGALSNIGIIPVSPSLDAVGWFANDPNILRRVGHALLQLPYAVPRAPRNIIIADDCFRLLKIPDSRVTPVVTKTSFESCEPRLLSGFQSAKLESVSEWQQKWRTQRFCNKVPCKCHAVSSKE